MHQLRSLLRGGMQISRPTYGMGSWAFIGLALVFLAGWMLGNRNAVGTATEPAGTNDPGAEPVPRPTMTS